jgi:D-glycero-D-manno-heptose 1,7-bisphosphate phosphatase
MSGRAVFIDRDGTLVEARHYPRRPEELVLCEGAADALRDLRRAGFRIVLVTNQSGIGRGYFDAGALRRMHAHLESELATCGARLDAIYYCPHTPEDGCDCRKPAPGMLVCAAQALDLELTRSWMVGDILDDIEAGRRAGCRTILVDRGTETLAAAAAQRRPDFVYPSTAAALRRIETEELSHASA